MKKQILLYGLQRSGSNFLEALLHRNFNIDFDIQKNASRDQPRHKHFRLYPQKEWVPEAKYHNCLHFNSFQEFVNSLELSLPIDGIIIIHKNPYSWLISYQKWAKTCNWPPSTHHYLQEYQAFYQHWWDFSQEDDRIIHLSYRDLLKNPRQILKVLQKKFGLVYFRPIRKILGPITRLPKVDLSPDFQKHQIRYYLQEDYLKEYSSETRKEFYQYLDPSLMQVLGYRLLA